jgi:peptidoglycan/xylan/chitin deacetylase (PgdA/CDA1 family)
MAAAAPSNLQPVALTAAPAEKPASFKPGEPAETAEPPRQGAPAAAEPVAEAQKVPVLMYHEITQGPNALYVPPEELEGHLKWLQDHGYHGITLKQLYGHYTRGDKIPDHPIVLTFDDGYVSFYTNAMPLLKKYGFPGTLFVITGSVGKPGVVTWDQVRAALRQGMEIGAHTVNHPDLAISGHDSVVYEVTESKRVLEEEIGQTVSFFCYPAGRYNDSVVKAVKDAGYIGAVTTKFGLAEPDQNPLLWSRVRVNQGTGPAGLGALIRMAEGK